MADEFNWSDLPGFGTDPAAGMPDWSNVTGSMPTDWTSLPGFGTDPSAGINGVIQGTGIQDDAGGNISRLLQVLKGKPSNMADLGSILGAFSSGEKADRFMQGNFTQNYDRLMLDAEKGRNATESDALKKLAQTSYIMGGGSKFKSPSLTLNGKNYQTPDLGYGPSPTTEAEKSGATSLQSQLGARLMPGGTYTPQPLDSYAKPGLAENVGSYGAAGLSGIQALFGGGGTPGQSGGSGVDSLGKGLGTTGTLLGLASQIAPHASTTAAAGSTAAGTSSGLSSNLGKAAAVAGIGAGAYGLAKNQDVKSDVMSGIGAGAGIGSFVGPLGTAVGAGVGALVGALRGAFSVTAKEQSGRDAQAAIAKNLGKLSTPQQQAESKQSGWPDPNQALALIVVRDALIKAGYPGPVAESKAEATMNSVWAAEKSGSSNVMQAFSPIQSILNAGTQNVSSGQTPIMGTTSAAPGGLITDAFSKGARG